MRVKQKAV
jgi:hypothetical protein